MTQRIDIPLDCDDECPACGDGHMQIKTPENCSCHMRSPCSACETTPLVCDQCGEETNEDWTMSIDATPKTDTDARPPGIPMPPPKATPKTAAQIVAESEAAAAAALDAMRAERDLWKQRAKVQRREKPTQRANAAALHAPNVRFLGSTTAEVDSTLPGRRGTITIEALADSWRVDVKVYPKPGVFQGEHVSATHIATWHDEAIALGRSYYADLCAVMDARNLRDAGK